MKMSGDALNKFDFQQTTTAESNHHQQHKSTQEGLAGEAHQAPAQPWSYYNDQNLEGTTGELFASCMGDLEQQEHHTEQYQYDKDHPGGVGSVVDLSALRPETRSSKTNSKSSLSVTASSEATAVEHLMAHSSNTAGHGQLHPAHLLGEPQPQRICGDALLYGEQSIADDGALEQHVAYGASLMEAQESVEDAEQVASVAAMANPLEEVSAHVPYGTSVEEVDCDGYVVDNKNNDVQDSDLEVEDVDLLPQENLYHVNQEDVEFYRPPEAVLLLAKPSKDHDGLCRENPVQDELVYSRDQNELQDLSLVGTFGGAAGTASSTSRREKSYHSAESPGSLRTRSTGASSTAARKSSPTTSTQRQEHLARHVRQEHLAQHQVHSPNNNAADNSCSSSSSSSSITGGTSTNTARVRKILKRGEGHVASRLLAALGPASHTHQIMGAPGAVKITPRAVVVTSSAGGEEQSQTAANSVQRPSSLPSPSTATASSGSQSAALSSGAPLMSARGPRTGGTTEYTQQQVKIKASHLTQRSPPFSSQKTAGQEQDGRISAGQEQDEAQHHLQSGVDASRFLCSSNQRNELQGRHLSYSDENPLQELQNNNTTSATVAPPVVVRRGSTASNASSVATNTESALFGHLLTDISTGGFNIGGGQHQHPFDAQSDLDINAVGTSLLDTSQDYSASTTNVKKQVRINLLGARRQALRDSLLTSTERQEANKKSFMGSTEDFIRDNFVSTEALLASSRSPDKDF
ncbi:unnamed protein product [Amoebophrya sp. A25]|nr:unnamed protein product [Amoebophrya sp. A25]|eukprot:GSA25T00008682001.1